MRIASLLLAFLVTTQVVSAADRPNIVWILSEDNSKHYLKLFDENGAETPRIAELAKNGLVFDHAFSCSPVCSVARTTLMTSIYAPRLGTQYHRKIRPVRMPDDWQMFPALLRSAGYYTSNNSKTDYNTASSQGVWDESSKKASWKKRPSTDTPFFHMQSHGQSHESSLHFTKKQIAPKKLTHDPATVSVEPRHPDTKLFRYTNAYYRDRMQVIDGIVGGVVDDLRKAGVLEDTFIFYFGDHGGVLPGSKGYLREVGLHVPLVVRIPENWRKRVAAPVGSRVDGFVSFVDFGPTVLNLASVDVPNYVDGKPFLGEDTSLAEVNQRQETFGYADRFDEKYDLVRSLRKGRWKYIRNYQAIYPDGLRNNYRYRMLAYQEWRDLHAAGKLSPVQSAFFESKPVEELYDLESDPWEQTNLANAEEHRGVLTDMRDRLTERVKGLPDLSFYPESVLVEDAAENPIPFGQNHAKEIGELIDVANLSLQPFTEAEEQLQTALASQNPWKRYWALMVCSTFGDDAASLIETARKLTRDSNLLVRLRAAEFLGVIQKDDPRPTIRRILQESQSPVVNLIVLNTVVFLEDYCGYDFALTNESIPVQSSEVKRRTEYLVD
ncbi:sulfatase-like hydrolase/transferase [Thalassoroseus pseudoceratinae]|uniref:sulfatase-like hydrolase/transferase n=1 Tax=Thalassoroseus pseudoceratinae TaxID=2713176 RepID=UPI0014214BF1|nr:sulfatase-like hydrolase/transferase [Thalassoroseus pseudoceratinae]